MHPPNPQNSGTAREDLADLAPGEERTIELREEQLVANKELRELGEIIVRTETETVPGRLELDAMREEVEVKHESVGEAVSERQQPWEEDGTLIVPVYEEQLVVTKRLILRERLHVRRVRTTERRLFEDTLQRERLVIEDPQQTQRVHEIYPTDEGQSANSSSHAEEAPADEGGGFLTRLMTKALE